MTRYTVKQLADLARISVRALHHYDDIGLLKPAYLGPNGYRYYERPQLYRLQQVMMYREFGFGLDQIATILDAPEFDTASALRQHRERLEERLKQQNALLGVIDATLSRLEGETKMQDSKLYDWASDAKLAETRTWLMERYGARLDGLIDASRARIEALTDAEKQSAKERRQDIESELLVAFKDGVAPGDKILSPLLARHREWMSEMRGRPCTLADQAQMADIYASHPDLSAHFAAAAPGFAAWLVTAIEAAGADQEA